MVLVKISNNLSLKPVEGKDAEELFALTEANRDYLREWLPWLDGTRSIEDTQSFIRHGKLAYEENRGMTFAILWKGKIAGVISYNTIDWTNKIAYIGYWLGAEYQGKGIMTKAAEALTDYAFTNLHLNRTEIAAAVENKKSRAIAERLGYKMEGIRREAEWLYDHYVDHAIYGMLAKEWKEKKALPSTEKNVEWEFGQKG